MTRSLAGRVVGLLAGLGLVATSAAVLAPASGPASAADRTALVVVGTSDVADSGLMSQVIEPGFEAAYPQYDLQYVPKGTGAAIQFAQAGTASGLIVHAAALENQFVQQGYSLEPYGRALTWGDYVLLGPRTADPAGVLGSDGSPSHDIVGAYQKIATAGAAGTALFVSRGGTPGTTVQEHAIWALTTGVPTCDVTAANGGGKAPLKTGGTGTCGTSTSNPSWYQTTGLNQGPNLVNANTCNYTGGPNTCYVFTDKGTFEFLRSQGAAGGVQDLRIVAQNNAVAGQENLLINSFHVYGINPAKFSDSSSIDTTGATDFLNWSTSPAAQQAIGSFLADDPDGAPFRPSAAPKIALSSVSSPGGTTVPGGTRLTFNGTVTNVVPGTPALDGVTVTLSARPKGDTSATPVAVATGTTGADGSFSIAYEPRGSFDYSLSTPGITKIEDSSLNPPFGDLLQPGSASGGSVDVRGVIDLKKGKATKGGKHQLLKVTGAISPAAASTGKPQVQLLAGHPGQKLTVRGSKSLRAYASSFSDVFGSLGRGTWVYRLRYVNDGVIDPGESTKGRITLR